MAYDTNKLVKLAELKATAERIKQETANDISSLSTRVGTLESAGGQPNVIESIKVNGTAQTITNKAVDIPVPGYSIAKDASSADYAAVYHLTKDGTNTGVAINIPKDMVVQSGEVVTYTSANKPSGVSDAGTYIKLVLQNVTDPLYINVGSLIEYVTSGSAVGDMVYVAVDATTHKVTATITDGTITKAKLHADLVNEIEATYTHPSYTAHTSGLYKVTVDATGHVSAVASVTKADITGLGIPAQDTTYSDMTAATASAAGAHGLVPAPAAGAQAKFLRGDGTWQTPTNTTYNVATQSANGLMSSTDKTKLDGMEIATDDEVTEMLNEVFAADAAA